jgi:hypothetical protein
LLDQLLASALSQFDLSAADPSVPAGPFPLLVERERSIERLRRAFPNIDFDGPGASAGGSR